MRYFQGLPGLLVTAAVAAMFAGAARAEEIVDPATADGPVVGVGVICNTSEQAEAFVSLRQQGQDVTPAVAQVNQTAQQPKACGVAAIAFVPDKTIGTKTVGGKLVKIVRVNVVAGYNGSGWQQVANTVQYAILEAQGTEI